jgi:AraC-like DNA-binding protein
MRRRTACPPRWASRLLADSRQADWTITDIAFSVGFKDASHFTRAFKNTHGCCPREYRHTASGRP